MKSLRPTMRENKRYLFVEGKNLKKNFKEAIKEFSGILGMSKVCPVFIKLNKTGNQAVVSINREGLDLVRASLAVWKENINVLKVSGTIKGLKINDF